MAECMLIAVGAALVNNVVLSQFLGLCPFLGVSKKTDTAAGMGAAVIFVIMIASAVTFIPACITVKVIISFPSAVNVFLSTLKITSVCSESSELPEQEIQHIPTQHIQTSNIIL